MTDRGGPGDERHRGVLLEDLCGILLARAWASYYAQIKVVVTFFGVFEHFGLQHFGFLWFSGTPEVLKRSGSLSGFIAA